MSFRPVERLALALVALNLTGAQQPQAPPASQVTVLGPDDVIERDVNVGETHRYSVELKAGQYLQLLVEQRGADVSEVLTGPDGGVLFEGDTLCGVMGPDPVAFTASTDGVHQLTLKALDALPTGRYEVRVEALRPPTPVDRLRAEAVRAGAEGLRLAHTEPAAAVERFRQAASHWRRLGERRLEMWMEQAMGTVLFEDLGRLEEARDVTTHALATARDLRDEWAEARLRFDLGLSLRGLGEFEEGKQQLQQALSQHRAAGREAEAAQTLVALGLSASQTGEAQEGLDHLFEALRGFQAADRPLYEALTRSQIAIAFLRLRDPESAVEQCRQALPALVEEPWMIPGLPTAERATCLTTIGRAYLELGDVPRARNAYSDALVILKAIARPFRAVLAHAGLGEIDAAAGDLAAAREAFGAALARTADDLFLQGVVQCRRGEVEIRLGDAEAARGAFEAALALAPRAGVLVTECAEAGLGQVARDSGDPSAALTHAERAVAAGESVRARLLGDQTRSVLLASQQSRYELLIDVLMRHHEQEPFGGHDVAAFETSERARARSLLELLAEGKIDVRRGVDPALLAEERSLRHKLNAAARAEVEARDVGRKDRVDASAGEVKALTARLAETEARVRRSSPAYAALTQPQPLTLSEIRRAVLDSETRLLQYALGEPRSYLWVVSSTSLQSFALAPGPEIERAARRVHELLSEPGTPAGRRGQWEARETALHTLSGLLLQPALGALDGKRLLVVAPGALQYVPFGALPLRQADSSLDVPGASASAPAEPLLARFEVVSAPSASVLATLRREQADRGHAARAVAVFADPVFDRHDPRVRGGVRSGRAEQPESAAGRGPADAFQRALRSLGGSRARVLARLPFSRREASAILAMVPPRSALEATGFDATREAAQNPALFEFRILHFATHGLLNPRHPDLSGIVLSLVDRAGRAQDGFLRLHDVYNLNLSAELVVLSGCQTALGKELGGEGLVGLTRGFMYAGARRVIASLWQVDDESTAELMKRFYRGMLKQGQRPADALRVAQLEMSRDRRWAAPFYWAGFVLQGDWR